MGSDMLIIYSWPMMARHDFRVWGYVEASDWTTPALCSAVIGWIVCVVRCHWSRAAGLVEWALLVGAVACQSLLLRQCCLRGCPGFCLKGST